MLASLASGGAAVAAAQLATGALSIRLTLHCTGVTVTGEGDCLECRGADERSVIVWQESGIEAGVTAAIGAALLMVGTVPVAAALL